ncbi:MAG: putative metal-binding motif-containing protein [Myxococcaceae bacterium]|nr:putative metal-binding motif-containing protein [Myxococcaceae bacterium]
MTPNLRRSMWLCVVVALAGCGGGGAPGPECSADADCGPSATCQAGSCNDKPMACKTPWYADGDGDGFGAGEAKLACTRPSGSVGKSGDCNDGDSTVSPDAAERCDAMNVDENCDGQIDEGCSGPDGGVPDAGMAGGAGGGAAGGGAAGGGAAGGGAAGGGAAVALDAGQPGCVPQTEVCDGVDNDCDQQIDEGVTVACLSDADSDGWATSGVAAQVCPGASGGCPAGSVAPAASQGIDCAPASATEFRTVTVRPDTDGDGYCLGAPSSLCVGLTVPTGKRLTSGCQATDDCNDMNLMQYRTVQTRADGDNDGFCQAPVMNSCVGATLPAGLKLPSACTAGFDDCNDADADKFAVSAFIVDVDGDRYCSGQVVNQCAGHVAPAGLRFPAECITQSDCNDSNANLYRLLSVRLDGDGDGYCFGQPTSQCSGLTPPAGFRLPGQCNAADDCRDTNPAAGAQCIVSAGYTTSSASKACVLVPATETFTVSTTNICPTGFVLQSYHANRTWGTGTCTATGPLTLSMTCNGLDGATCNIVGTCVAL